MEKDSPCEFVSAEYIICECGDNFPSEEKLRIHLVNDHGQLAERPKPREREKPRPLEKKVVVIQQPQEYITPEPAPIQENDTPKLFIFAGAGRPKPIKITRPLYILRAEDIKQEIVFENLTDNTSYTVVPQDVSDYETTVKLEADERGNQLLADEFPFKEEPKDEEQLTLRYEDESSQDSQEATLQPEDEHNALITYEEEELNQEEIEEEELVEDGVYEGQEGQEPGIEYEEIQYEEIQLDEDIPAEEMTFQTVRRAHWLTEHNYDVVGGAPADQPEYFCDVCGKSFPYEKSVNLHKRVHRPKSWVPPEGTKKKSYKPVVCDICGKKYASPAQLRYHQRVHTGERPYVCQFCPKKFTMPLFLQIHIRTHTGEKPYQCPLCPKAFTNRAALLRHERVHTGVKPYPCPECGKCFSQSNSMKLHVRTVHMKLPAPYKSKARKLKELRRKEMLAMREACDLPPKMVARPQKTTPRVQKSTPCSEKAPMFEETEECLLYDGDGKVVLALSAIVDKVKKSELRILNRDL